MPYINCSASQLVKSVSWNLCDNIQRCGKSSTVLSHFQTTMHGTLVVLDKHINGSVQFILIVFSCVNI